ncbi:alpha--n-acetylglucosaminyltransferase extl3isoform 1 [Lichtheimia corymbifera JMRC:FSU:9682]|uniref:Alpha--n-acetylglucosaminyltransferase extl3isoform 1 n=1 Tax=Lichtheimia corymbifera JMRC:FSU:9682 TaxID=1263082 RepID=A0A068S0F7_9FUNG|nr:alpha--n-acetylglucosaminyltransferase extl3isoform 1 [Lichtheimia corymbifera JMRC:FSU:9682]
MVCSVAYIIRPLSIPPPVSSPSSTPAVVSMEQQQPMGDYFLDKAYVTIIHNELEIDPAKVALYSLYKTHPQARIVAIIPDTFSEDNATSIQSIGLNTAVIKAPSASSSATLDTTEIWNFVPTTLEKLLYFSTEIMFQKNVDHYFGYVAHTVLKKDAAIGLKVLERGEQTSSSSLLIPETFPMADQEVFWFHGPMKPWNAHQYHGIDWQTHYNPLPFYHWRHLHDELAFSNKGETAQWINQDRRRLLCDDASSTMMSPKNNIDQFTVLLSTYNPERIQHLQLLIQHLLQSTQAHKIFVTWHNPHLDVPDALLQMGERVTILQQSYDSLNNRFNPINAIETEAVYIIDDDVLVDIQDIEFTFEVWRLNKDSIVGHFPRLHGYNPETHKGSYRVPKDDEAYSMILTKSMFARTDYLFTYTCLLDKELHHIIDERTNCEDIAFNMMVSGMTGAKSIAVIPSKPMIDYGGKKGISTNNHHMEERRECAGRFITEYWDAVDPLIMSHSAVVRRVGPQIQKGRWENMQADLHSSFV